MITAVLSYWFVGIISGSVLVPSALITALIAVNTKEIKTGTNSGK